MELSTTEGCAHEVSPRGGGEGTLHLQIWATDAYAERRPMQETEEVIDRTICKGLKHNVRVEPENILYVTADELLEGLYEPGKFYWKKEGGPMRVPNSSHLQRHVMREYLEERTKILTSKYPWDRSEMGFLAYKWGKKKRMRYSKQETQHIYDKKAHGRNIKKGDPKFDAICPLCLHNDETQAHILLRCFHPAMKYWREEYFAKCTTTIKEQKDPVLEEYLGGLWEWIAQPLDDEDQSVIDIDRRRVALMLGRPIRKDLERPGSQAHLTAGQIQKMQKSILELWQTSLEFVVTT
jgi:hypothetical protein